MRTQPIVRFTLAVLLALFIAPVATAQSSTWTALSTTVGEPVPFRVGLPEGAEIRREQGSVTAVSAGFLVRAGASDLLPELALEQGRFEAKLRRRLTDRLVRSDGTLLGLAGELQGVLGEGAEVLPVVRKVRTLGGRRAAYVQARVRQNGTERWLESYITARDGLCYVLIFMGEGDSGAAHEPLFARIRDSFVLAAAPQFAVGQQRPEKPGS